jgi:nickel-dependent lactate racemase
MTKKKVSVDYGHGKLDIEVPESAVVVEFEDPPLLKDPAAAVKHAIDNPHGSPPLSALAKPGMRVAIGFDDPTRPANPPQTILPIVIDELIRCGVSERDILLINACSNHRKCTRGELAAHLGARLFNRFWPTGQILNHDCSDPAQLKFFGITDGGRYVEMNRHFVEADLMIYQGNVASTAWRSFTGTGVAIGLGSTKSIASHHSFHGIPDPGAKTEKKVRLSVKEEMTNFLDEKLGRQVFYINAVNGTKGQMAGVYAGSAAGVKPPAWELADKIYRKPCPQADVLIVGLPGNFSYGSSNNLLVAAVGAMVPPRHSPEQPILREGGVVIATCPTTGHLDPDRFPSYQEAVDLYGRYHSVRALVDHEDEFANRPEYLHRYTYGYGYPPLHPFWVLYELDYAWKRAGALIIAGASNPGPFRGLNMVPAQDFAEAWKTAEKYVGKNPTTVVAPTFWSKPRIKFDVRNAGG